MARDSRELGSAWTRFQRHDFPSPAPDLAPYVEYYWVVTWDYAEPYRQLIVPYPNVHLTFQDGGATLHGVATAHQIRVLEGRNGVFGVAFHPGCFRPFLRASVSTLTDRSIDAREVFPECLPVPAEVGTVEQFLRAHLPEPDTRAQEAAAVVKRIRTDRTTMRVDALARDVRMGVRQLQRLFAEYVGVGPKWVIRRYRLHEVTERFAAGHRIDWADLAAELGYADQAHFTRDFKDMFGETPTWYAERYQEGWQRRVTSRQDLAARRWGPGDTVAVDGLEDRLALARGQHAETVNFNTEDPVEMIVDLTQG